MSAAWSWLEGMLPDPTTGIRVAGAAAAWGTAAAVAAAHLRKRGVRTPYTRKVFHFAIFSGAGVVHAVAGLPATNVYGAVIAGLVLLAVFRGDGHPFYEALARPSDRPRRSLFVVAPLISTAVGGLASAVLAGPLASVGYLVAGWGDAVGEPVGVRWGRHPYRVPSLAGVPATRTLEGSAAVFVVGSVAALLALRLLGHPWEAAVLGALACAAAGAVVEAVSNHGLDNLTVQLAASLTALWLLG